MKVTLPNGRKLRFYIKHEHTPEDGRMIPDSMKKRPKYSVVTTAKVFDITRDDKNEQVIAQGQSKCFNGDPLRGVAPDQFRRHEGVKRAVARALRDMRELSKADRTEIWGRIWNRQNEERTRNQRAVDKIRSIAKKLGIAVLIPNN